MKPGNFKVAAYLLLVFASGIAVGAFSLHLYAARTVSARSMRSHSPEEYRKKYLGEMQSRLGLSPEQAAKLNGILDQTRSRFAELRERSKPGTDAIQKEQTNQINEILNDTQRVEYEKFRKERDLNRQKSRNSPQGH